VADVTGPIKSTITTRSSFATKHYEYASFNVQEHPKKTDEPKMWNETKTWNYEVIIIRAGYGSDAGATRYTQPAPDW